MREILFRGKRLDNGEWIEGHLIQYEDGRARICESHTDIFCYEKDRSIIQTVAHEVRPSTVGQYTGLTDENGKRIFEGDIVQYHERQFDGKDEPVRDAVVYEEGGFAVRAYFLNNWLWNSINGNVQLRDVEIIGNIHDNPELLKEGADNG